MVQDKFGVNELYQTLPGGREWNSKWDNGNARSWNDQSNDPDDPEFITANKGTGSWSTDGQGILKISGSGPRMYVMHSDQTGHWHDVEITVYGMRIADDNTPFGGIMAYARTNHFIDANICDDRGYGGRFTYDGRMDFEKETAHHMKDGNVQVATNKYWPNGMTKNVWIGYKYVVYDLQDGNVKLELYIDNTDGANGGTWVKTTEFTDTGKNFGVGATSCKSGIDPALKLTDSDIRPGSETGKPNLAIYFRSDGVSANGLLYKKASIREITTSAVQNKWKCSGAPDFVCSQTTDTTGTLYDTQAECEAACISPTTSITVTSPASGDSYKKGDHRTIKWISVGNVGPNVKVELKRGDHLVKTIASNTANDGQKSWEVPHVTSSKEYQIKITSKIDNKIFGVSGKFSIR